MEEPVRSCRQGHAGKPDGFAECDLRGLFRKTLGVRAIDTENGCDQHARQADAERQRLGLDENSFAIHKTVVEVDSGFDAKQAKAVNTLFDQNPDYRWNKQQESKLRTELYKTLRPLIGTGKMIDVANRLLKLQRV